MFGASGAKYHGGAKPRERVPVAPKKKPAVLWTRKPKLRQVDHTLIEPEHGFFCKKTHAALFDIFW